MQTKESAALALQEPAPAGGVHIFDRRVDRRYALHIINSFYRELRAELMKSTDIRAFILSDGGNGMMNIRLTNDMLEFGLSVREGGES